MRASRSKRVQWVRRMWLGAISCFWIAGCATSPEQQEIRDTLEPVNRPVFRVNEGVDDYALGPVARGWKKITPESVRDSISNAYHNLTFPQRFVSSVGQAEPRKAGVELARFVVNSTLGVAGLFDPASRLGLAKYDEDIGQMFARWGIPPGPYIVIPILGPSTPRDAIGGLIALALNPLLWTAVSVPGLGALFAVNGRAQADQEIEIARRSALDYYVFVRQVFVQHRSWQIRTEYVTRYDDEALYELPPDLYELPEESEPCDPARAAGGDSQAEDRC